MIRQHDPARTNTDAAGICGDIPDHDCGGRARNADDVVMFGERSGDSPTSPRVAPVLRAFLRASGRSRLLEQTRDQELREAS